MIRYSLLVTRQQPSPAAVHTLVTESPSWNTAQLNYSPSRIICLLQQQKSKLKKYKTLFLIQKIYFKKSFAETTEVIVNFK